jgi:hypothetical protein
MWRSNARDVADAVTVVAAFCAISLHFHEWVDLRLTKMDSFQLVGEVRMKQLFSRKGTPPNFMRTSLSLVASLGRVNRM